MCAQNLHATSTEETYYKRFTIFGFGFANLFGYFEAFYHLTNGHVRTVEMLARLYRDKELRIIGIRIARIRHTNDSGFGVLWGKL